jgi:hypothetical protein
LVQRTIRRLYSSTWRKAEIWPELSPHTAQLVSPQIVARMQMCKACWIRTVTRITEWHCSEHWQCIGAPPHMLNIDTQRICRSASASPCQWMEHAANAAKCFDLRFHGARSSTSAIGPGLACGAWHVKEFAVRNVVGFAASA